MIKIFLRSGNGVLQQSLDGRHRVGMAIHHDGLLRIMQNCPHIDLVAEYPLDTMERQAPPDSSYKALYFGIPDEWDMSWTGKKIAYTICHETPLLDRWLDKINQCDYVLFASQSCAEYHSYHGITKPIGVWPGGIDNQFQYINRDFNQSPFRFLHLGVTQWRKGSDVLCEAFNMAFNPCDSVELVIRSIGKTDMFTNLYNKYCHDNRYIFQIWNSPHSEMAKQYSDCHCLVYPSITEGWGLVLPEAMATGMPAIVSRRSVMLDQFSKECGWWVDTKDGDDIGDVAICVNSLANSMIEAFANRQECNRCGINASKRALTELTWQQSIEQVLPVLDAI